MNKKKVIVKTVPGEAVLVASMDTFNHIIETYMYMASCSDSEEERASWEAVASLVSEYVASTYHPQESSYEEEW
jgi:alcohol dehydrogenase class IV